VKFYDVQQVMVKPHWPLARWRKNHPTHECVMNFPVITTNTGNLPVGIQIFWNPIVLCSRNVWLLFICQNINRSASFTTIFTKVGIHFLKGIVPHYNYCYSGSRNLWLQGTFPKLKSSSNILTKVLNLNIFNPTCCFGPEILNKTINDHNHICNVKFSPRSFNLVFCIIVCPFVLFLSAIVLSVVLRYMNFDYAFNLFKLFFHIFD
jgi:hypothetical protein